MRKLPSKIKLGHTELSVVESTDSLDPGDLGEFSSHHRRITLAPGQGHAEQVNTLLHELAHAAYYFDALRQDETEEAKNEEERIVTCVANRLAEALLRNRRLREFILKGELR